MAADCPHSSLLALHGVLQTSNPYLLCPRRSVLFCNLAASVDGGDDGDDADEDAASGSAPAGSESSPQHSRHSQHSQHSQQSQQPGPSSAPPDASQPPPHKHLPLPAAATALRSSAAGVQTHRTSGGGATTHRVSMAGSMSGSAAARIREISGTLQGGTPTAKTLASVKTLNKSVKRSMDNVRPL